LWGGELGGPVRDYREEGGKGTGSAEETPGNSSQSRKKKEKRPERSDGKTATTQKKAKKKVKKGEECKKNRAGQGPGCDPAQTKST